MLKFFRRIRQQLLTRDAPPRQGSKDRNLVSKDQSSLTTASSKRASIPLARRQATGKYLLYAVGEIILVVIGILIALQINNWNDFKKSRASENDYYCRILDDFNLDKKRIEELVDKDNHRITTSKEILLELDSGSKSKSYILNKFLVALRSDVYVPRDVTFQDLIASGNLKLLTDLALKNSLIQYYSELENKLAQLIQNRDEKIKQSFELVNSSVGFGQHEFDYIANLLGSEIIKILPNDNWTMEKGSESYLNFQQMLIFNVAMAEREKQHLFAIQDLMESPLNLLEARCGRIAK